MAQRESSNMANMFHLQLLVRSSVLSLPCQSLSSYLVVPQQKFLKIDQVPCASGLRVSRQGRSLLGVSTALSQ